MNMISKQKRAQKSASLKQVLKDLGYTQPLSHKNITSGMGSRLKATYPYKHVTYVVGDDAVVQPYAPYNANAGFIHKQALLDRQEMISLLDSELSEEELEKVINAMLDSLWHLDETATTNASIDFYVKTLESITGFTIYERIMNGESIRVKLKCPMEKQRKTPFTVRALYLMDDTHYVTKSSVWFKFSHVGGLWIAQKRHALTNDEMIWWCDQVEEVKA